jgi:hypothetical protein
MQSSHAFFRICLQASTIRMRFNSTAVAVRLETLPDDATSGRNFFDVYVDGELLGAVLVQANQEPRIPVWPVVSCCRVE